MNDVLPRHAFSFRFVGVTAVVLILAAAGCDPNRPNPELSQRLEQDIYSFVPPVEPGWLIANRSPDRIALVKLGKVDGQSYVIESSHLPLDGLADSSGLADFADGVHKKGFPRPRFRIQTHDLSDVRVADANCALSHIVAEDRNPEIGSNVVTALLIETVGTICIHPSRPNVGIALMYSHRSYPEDRDRGFATRATGFLQTQLFSDVNARDGN